MDTLFKNLIACKEICIIHLPLLISNSKIFKSKRCLMTKLCSNFSPLT